jgi:diacylglycerol kinase (ATP)
MKRLICAFLYSLAGFASAWRDETAFRQEVVLAALMLPLAMFIAPNWQTMLMLQLSVLFVLVVELVNTAVEAAIDRHGEELHPQSKKAKDCASAAVLIALIMCKMVWAAVIWDQFIRHSTSTF